MKEAILEDGILMFRMVWLYLIAEAAAEELGRPRPFFGLEQPKDPESWVRPQEMGIEKPQEGFSSCWALQAIKDLAAEHNFYFWHFDQGPLGHEKRKPTTIMSTVPPPPDVLVSGPGHGVPSKQPVGSESRAQWPSAAWAVWVPQLKNIIKREVLSALDAWTSVRCKALRDHENFLRHVVQGHVDFRRDCSACLAGAARGERRNRKSVHDAWVLRVDLMGPFSEGSDEHGKVKYVLTGVLTLPDFAKVGDAVRGSEDIASGSTDGPDPGGLLEPGPVESSVPLSLLGAPVSLSLPPVEEDDLEDYEPSDQEAGDEVMTLLPEEEVPAETEAEKQRWEAAALALRLKACPVLEVPFIRHLPDKSQATVAQGLMAMIAQIGYEGFMLRRLHSDRGREFNNASVHRLCRQRDVYQTFTHGDDPQQNGRVEAFHARLKGKTRTLLKGAGAADPDWPYAMRTAHASMLSRALEKLGRRPCLPLPFGTQVRVRTRSWERDLWSDRVQDAIVLAPSIETCKGHVVRTAQGTLMHTTAVFRGAVQAASSPVGRGTCPLPAAARFAPVPRSAPDGPEVTLSFPADSVPARRIVGKQSLNEKMLRVGATAADVQALSSAAAALLTHRPVPFRAASGLLHSARALWDCARPLPPRLSATNSARYLLFGWYKRGGLTGITRLTDRMPGVVQLLNAMLAQAAPAATWTTLALFSSPAAGPHVDRRNLKGSHNYVLPLALPPDEPYIWVQRPVHSTLQSLSWLGEQGQVLPGFRLPLVVGHCVCVDPSTLRALPEPLPESRAAPYVVLVGYSVPGSEHAAPAHLQSLQASGFRLPFSRGGVSAEGFGPGGEVSAKGCGPEGEGLSLGGAREGARSLFLSQQLSSVYEGEDPGLLEVGLIAEGHRQLSSNAFGAGIAPAHINQDVQEDTAAEGSVTGRGAYARRLEARVFEPANWDRVKQYLIGLGLEHLIGAIDDLGVDDLEEKISWKPARPNKRLKLSSDARARLRKEDQTLRLWPERGITGRVGQRRRGSKVRQSQLGL